MIFSDSLVAGMKAVPVQLGKMRVRKNHKMICKELWQEAIFSCHLQDDRLTDKERQVIAAIGFRLHGKRSIV